MSGGSYRGHFLQTSPWSPSTGVWYHIAFIRNGSTGLLFIDGISQPLTVFTAFSTLPALSAILTVGTDNDGSYVKGYMDEVRISKGIARWTNNFTPPSTPYAPSVSGDMILQSNAKVATITPINSRIVLFEEDVDSVTLNTDLKAYVSRDNGTTFSQITLEDEGNYITGARILSGVVDISAQPSGTDVVYKITTHNTKKLKIHGTGISWK